MCIYVHVQRERKLFHMCTIVLDMDIVLAPNKCIYAILQIENTSQFKYSVYSNNKSMTMLNANFLFSFF